MGPLLQGVFSQHRTVHAAALCLEKGQRGHLLVEQHERRHGASWSICYHLGFPSSQCMVSPTVTNPEALDSPQQMPTGRLSSHEDLAGRDFWKSLSISSSWMIPSAKSGLLWFVQQKVQPHSKHGGSPNPSGDLPLGCTFSPQ